MIDWTRVRELRAEIGADAFDEVLELFLEEVEDGLDTLKSAATDSAIEEQVHFLKGSALNLGFAALAELCEENERRARNGEGDTVQINEIICGYESSKAAFLDGIADAIAA